jgi:outer membrane receptor protein involved in Fe transport
MPCPSKRGTMAFWAGLAAGAWCTVVSAHPSDMSLDTVTVVATGVSNMTAASAGDIGAQELASQPLLRPGAIQSLGTTQDAAVRESNAALYFENSMQWRPWLRSVLGLRADQFHFAVTDKMRNPDGSCDIESDPLGCNSGTRSASIFSPKVALVLGPRAHTSFYVNVADGYHSNDARGVTRSGENPDAAAVTPLTRATSAEVGLSSEPGDGWETSLDVFQLKLKSELVFSGDAASPSRAVRPRAQASSGVTHSASIAGCQRI